MSLEEFLAKVCARPMPSNRMAQVRTLAKELAEGVLDEQWSTSIWLYRLPARDQLEIHDDNLEQYMQERWRDASDEREARSLPRLLDEKRLFDLLIAGDFLSSPVEPNGAIHTIEQKCIDLLEANEPETIFVSYKRNESSAFALLTLRYLKQHGMEAFLDLAIDPGANWHASLEEKIEICDFMVLLLGKTTLSSVNVCKEILWALDKGKEIIPIRQPDFDFNCITWPNELPAESQERIGKKVNLTNAIQVIEESALEYHKAMTALLNRFGVTP